MSLLGLNSIVPAALTTVVAQTADKLADGLSFAETLLRGGTSAPADATGDDEARREAALVEFETRLDDFRKLLQERLAAAGIDTSAPLTLVDDGFGGVACDGDHPARAWIERLFAGNGELTAAYGALAADYARLQAAPAGNPDGPPDDGEFSTDEPAAYERLLDDLDRHGFRLTLHGEQATVSPR
jgi:hypothetical protein